MNNKLKAPCRTAVLIAAAALAGLTAARQTEAQTMASLPRPSYPVEALGEARPLLAWIDFCNRYPGECGVDRTEPALIALTPRVWQTIISVNRRVNAAIRPVTDLDHWGVPDRWDLAEDGQGDCEDFQLLKRRLLAEAGLPRRAMRMTVVVDDKGEGHAVLMIRTAQGDFVLDNKTSAILPWHQTGYVFVKRESQNGVGWVSLGRAVSPTATANP